MHRRAHGRALALAQGLEPTDLMRLKRTPPAPAPASVGGAAPGDGGGGAAGPADGGALAAPLPRGGAAAARSAPEPFICRHAGGMCFDFAGQDGRAYLVGALPLLTLQGVLPAQSSFRIGRRARRQGWAVWSPHGTLGH